MKKHTLLSYLITLSFLNIGYTQGASEIIKEFKNDEVFDYEAWGVSVDEEGFIYWQVNIDSLNTGYDIAICF